MSCAVGRSFTRGAHLSLTTRTSLVPGACLAYVSRTYVSRVSRSPRIRRLSPGGAAGALGGGTHTRLAEAAVLSVRAPTVWVAVYALSSDLLGRDLSPRLCGSVTLGQTGKWGCDCWNTAPLVLIIVLEFLVFFFLLASYWFTSYLRNTVFPKFP